MNEQWENASTNLQSPDYALMHQFMFELPARIKALRKGLGLTQAEFATRLRVTQSTVSRWERDMEPKIEELRALADLAGEDLHSFLGYGRNAAPLSPIVVIGAVEAGLWKEAVEWDEQQFYQIWMPPDPRYPDFKRAGLEVRGPSMNEIYPEGSVVVFIRIGDLGRNPQSGEKVVCFRRDRHGGVEATVKEYQEAGSGRWLWPRSNHPEFQQPLSLDSPPNDEEIWIEGLVVQSARLE